MSFSAQWLAQRAPFDSAARSVELERRLAVWAQARIRRTGRPLSVIDLGAGSGGNRRHLAPRLDVAQHWTLVDSDPALLQAAGTGADFDTVTSDLASNLENVVIDGVDLVTASALLDLVSEPWLGRLAEATRSAGAALLAVLSYDGRIEWSAPDPFDRTVCELVNRHQRRDKGFGAAIGPDAGAELAKLTGPALLEARSDWEIGPDDDEMRAVLVDGWALAVSESDPDRAGEIEAWRVASRHRRCDLVVGHSDHLLLTEP